MSLLYNLLDEQIELLKKKGYEEKSIGSPDKEGWLFTQLRRSFSDALHQSWQEGEPVSFQITTTGFFNDEKDIVHFKFNYEFDLQNNSLSMQELELVADGINRKIAIQATQDIPHSSQALLLIRGMTHLQRQQTARYVPVHASKQNRKVR